MCECARVHTVDECAGLCMGMHGCPWVCGAHVCAGAGAASPCMDLRAPVPRTGVLPAFARSDFLNPWYSDLFFSIFFTPSPPSPEYSQNLNNDIWLCCSRHGVLLRKVRVAVSPGFDLFHNTKSCMLCSVRVQFLNQGLT